MSYGECAYGTCSLMAGHLGPCSDGVDRRPNGSGPHGRELAAKDAEIARLRDALVWQPITQKNLPTGRPHLLYMDRGGEDVYAVGYFNRLTRSWFIHDIDQGRFVQVGYTHFLPLNAPAALEAKHD